MNEYFFAFLFLLRTRTKFNNKEHFRSYKWIIFYFCCCFCYYCCCFMILCLFCRRAGVRSFVQSKIIFSVYVLYICFIICIFFFCYDCIFLLFIILFYLFCNLVSVNSKISLLQNNKTDKKRYKIKKKQTWQ